VSIVGTPGTGNVLTWSGSAWSQAAPGAVTSIANGGSNVSLSGLGALTSSISGNNAISQTTAGTTVIGGFKSTLTLDSGGGFSLLHPTGAFFKTDGSGDLFIQSSPGCVAQWADPTGNAVVTVVPGAQAYMSAGGCTVRVDSAGTIDLTPFSGPKLKITAGSALEIIGGSGTMLRVNDTNGLYLDPSNVLGIGAFGATPVAQQTALGTLAGFTPNTSANIVYNESTWDGGLGGSAYTIDDVVLALKKYGWLAA